MEGGREAGRGREGEREVTADMHHNHWGESCVCVCVEGEGEGPRACRGGRLMSNTEREREREREREKTERSEWGGVSPKGAQ
jgi:hypothetical protein